MTVIAGFSRRSGRLAALSAPAGLAQARSSRLPPATTEISGARGYLAGPRPPSGRQAVSGWSQAFRGFPRRPASKKQNRPNARRRFIAAMSLRTASSIQWQPPGLLRNPGLTPLSPGTAVVAVLGGVGPALPLSLAGGCSDVISKPAGALAGNKPERERQADELG